GRRPCAGERAAHIPAVLHDQAGRHGNGAVDQYDDRRGARRPAMGLAGARQRHRVSFHPAVDGMRQAVTEETSTVLIVDDDVAVRDALRDLFEAVGVRVEAFASAPEILQAKRPDAPCCLVLDVRLPGPSGLDFQRELNEKNIVLPIVFLTGHGDIPMSVRAMKAGAVEFLTKPFREQDLLDAVQAALDRDRAGREEERVRAALRARFDLLTPRERAVMGLVVTGRRNKQIAHEIAASETTVKVHRTNLMRKMQASSLADLIAMAGKLGLPQESPAAVKVEA